MKVILFFVILGIFSPAFAQSDIYAYTHAEMLSPAVKQALSRVYVPNGKNGTVSVIDPATYKVVEVFETGREPQHVVPSYDLQTLWVLNNKSYSVTPIDPMTGKPGKNIDVDDPYNLYFTPDGKFAIVVCEELKELQFRDPKNMKLLSSLPVTCGGANHMDFTVDGHYALVTCEFSGQLMKLDVLKQKVIGYLSLGKSAPKKSASLDEITITEDGRVFQGEDPQNHFIDSMPQDIRSSADGRTFFVADMMKDGVILIDPVKFKRVGFIGTGIGTHAIYPSRDGKLFYISNRGCHQMQCNAHGPGSIAVLDPVKKVIIARWSIPEGGSPDMGNVTADGRELWLSGRYDSEVYVFDTSSGKLLHRIGVGPGPHGLTVWPQPGRYSLGHTGNMR